MSDEKEKKRIEADIKAKIKRERSEPYIQEKLNNFKRLINEAKAVKNTKLAEIYENYKKEFLAKAGAKATKMLADTEAKKAAEIVAAKQQADMEVANALKDAEMRAEIKRVAELKVAAEVKADETKDAIDQYHEAALTLDEEQRAIQFEEENPGKKAIWNGKFTQAFLLWEKNVFK